MKNGQLSTHVCLLMRTEKAKNHNNKERIVISTLLLVDDDRTVQTVFAVMGKEW